MSQFAAFSPFELPSFEKVEKGRYQWVGGKELGGKGWKELVFVCVCGGLHLQLRGAGMWGVLVGTEIFNTVSPRP